MSMTLVFPARLDPVVWGITTSMTAESSPFPTAIARTEQDDQVVFTWSTDEPPLHARYRIEWKFRAPEDGETSGMDTMGPAERMIAWASFRRAIRYWPKSPGRSTCPPRPRTRGGW